MACKERIPTKMRAGMERARRLQEFGVITG